MIDWREGETGIGSLLMTDPELPRHRTGHPFQAVFVFDADGHATRLARDEEGLAVGYDYDDDGEVVADPEQLIALPESVALAAERWFAEHGPRDSL